MEKDKLILGTFKFMYNIPHTFISDVWGGTYLESHFKAKYDSFCSQHGGYASGSAIIAFMGSLDGDNSKLMADYIVNWIEKREKRKIAE